MINRREFVGLTLGAGALALTPQVLRALEQSGGKLIHRAIPSSGELVPIISFGPRPPVDPAAMQSVLTALLNNGGTVVDVLHGGPMGEQGARTAATELGIQHKFSWTTPLSVTIPPVPGSPAGQQPKSTPAAVLAAMEGKFAAFKVEKIDVVMVSIGAHHESHFAALRQLKKEGRVRYVGVHALLPPPGEQRPVDVFARLESVMRNEPIDFIGTDYSLGDRRLEEKILPLALERKIGALAYFPFDRGRMFQRASSTPLPEWAAECDAKSWAQFFLKYVISHPAVVMARTGTSKAAHMLDNIRGGTGRLPDETMRKRMAAFMDTLPATRPQGQQP